MSNKKTTPERLATFSDAVFDVIITIMVLDLKPPAEVCPGFCPGGDRLHRLRERSDFSGT